MIIISGLTALQLCCWRAAADARFVLPGAVRLEVGGDWSGSAIAARNPSGEIAIVVMNPHTTSRKFVFHAPASTPASTPVSTPASTLTSSFTFEVQLEPRSFNSFLVPKL